MEPKDLNDPSKVVTYRNKSMEYYGKHISVCEIKNTEDIDY
jgi:hypothetical protein